ncbi:MAG: hypothetical protein G01um101444_254 [Parcubacteria group bacterium Gr01-1014_44]|nr:MAG: hypothetical protein G01um101444_254 [Parcubacteria group bacterium Gr01-1014_44]
MVKKRPAVHSNLDGFLTLAVSMLFFFCFLAIPQFFLAMLDKTNSTKEALGLVSAFEKALFNLGVSSLFTGITYLLILIQNNPRPTQT